ncbi:MAG TPA: bile acid:sodium symporter family protein [Abditibacteriaceae bacterium]|jgi:sodium/bile acid cotransporter 7
MKWKIDWFLVGIAVAVALAWFFPDPGAKGGWLHPELLTKAGVALIFFLHGLSLSFERLKAGTLRWPLHLIVQTCTFVVFPLLGFVLLWFFGSLLPADLRLGFFYLCALPSTVSSSVAMTAAARGNVPVAVFNATLSSLIGIFITPLWIGLVMKSGGQSIPLGNVILDLVLWLLLPLAVGQLCRPLLGARAAAHKPLISTVDRGTILLLVYTSFCDSVKQNVWGEYGAASLIPTIVGALLLFTIVFFVLRAACNWLGVPLGDQSAVIFCGTKKTLASGVPMAHLIFGAHPGLGLILLPIMIYHSMQLVICGWLAGRWAQRAELAA